MEKVKITKEQEEALLLFMDNEKDSDIFYILNVELGNWSSCYKSLNKFSIESFSYLLNGWYEVEQPFKVGDWLYDGMYYVKIEKFLGEHVLFKGEDWDFINNLDDCYKKVDEPWKIRLLELDREKPELKIGDVYVDIYGVACLIEDQSFLESTVSDEFETNLVAKIFPHEVGIEVKG